MACSHVELNKIVGVSNRPRYVAVEAMRRRAGRPGDAIGRWHTGCRGPHAEIDGSWGRRSCRRPEASLEAAREVEPDATRDAPVSQVDGARRMAERRPSDRDGRRKALTHEAQGNGTKAPASNKQGKQPVLDPKRQMQRQKHNTATPQRRAERPGWVEPSPVRTNLSSKPGRTLPGVEASVTAGRAFAKGSKAPLAAMLAQM